jgi:Putative zinc-finger
MSPGISNMNCEQVQERLSRFHDSELSPPERAAIELHLASCPVCPGELAAIAELSEMARTTPVPEPPPGQWQEIELRLARTTSSRVTWARRLVPGWRMAAGLAALLLLAFGGTWLARREQAPDSTQHAQETSPADEDGPLLDQLLVAAPRAESISLQEAARRVAFRLPSSPQLPEGYQLQGCCLCRDGCCDLVQCQFLCGSDQVLLFLGSSDRPTRYGARPVLETQVDGKPARIVQCDCGLACSWQCHGTTVTLIGPRDLSKLVQLVSFVNERMAKRPN